jgi:hypothetical protein
MEGKRVSKKKHPLEQGSIALIFKKFIGPLVRYKPHTMDLKGFWEYLFHVGARDIERYVVAKPFRMPGLCFVAPTVKIQGVGPRDVKPGTILWVRTDADTPDLIDVQWLAPGLDVTYSLTASEWGWVRLKLKAKENHG